MPPSDERAEGDAVIPPRPGGLPDELPSSEMPLTAWRRALILPKQCRRPFRHLITAVTALLVVTMLFAAEAKRRESRQKQLISAIEEAHGTARLGPPLFDRIRAWHETGVFPPWECMVWLFPPGVTNEWVRNHDYLRSLNVTFLECHGMTGRDLAHLIESHPLEFLIIGNTTVSEEVIEAISRHGRLRKLLLHNLNLTDRDMGFLPLEDLESFRAIETEVTEEGLQQLSRCRRLRHVGLDGTQLTPKAIQILSSLGTVREITVHGQQVTDELMPTLAQLRTLESVQLYRTATTTEGHAALRSVIPYIQISGN